MTILIITAILISLIISYIVGQRHGEINRRDEILAQLYSLSHFIDGEAKKTSDEIFNHLNRYRNESN